MLVPRSIALLGLLALVPTSHAADLPPQDAPAYTGVYRAVNRSREKQDEDWKYVTEDTITIAVLNKQSRWDRKTEGSTIINDGGSRTSTRFGGKVPPGTAVRSHARYVAIGWEFGYAIVAKATEKPPEVLGTATIAGQECTRLKYISSQYGEPEYCVTKSGIVLRFTNKSADADAVYEAISITEKAPAPDIFKTPADLEIQEKNPARRLKLPL